MISKKVFINTLDVQIDPIGVTTDNHNIGCDLEIEGKIALETGDMSKFKSMLSGFEHAEILKGENENYEMFSKEIIDPDSGLKSWEIPKLTKQEANYIAAKIMDAKLTPENAIKVGIDIQNIGRQAQEGDIDAFKTFVLINKVLPSWKLKKIKTRLKEDSDLICKLNWELENLEYKAQKEKFDYDFETCIYNSSIAEDVDKAFEILAEKFKPLMERKQKINRLKNVVENNNVQIPMDLQIIMDLIHGQFMTLSTARSKKKFKVQKEMQGVLDKVQRATLSNEFDPLFNGLRGLLRKAMRKYDNGNLQKRCLTAIKRCVSTCNTLEDDSKSDVFSQILDRLLTEELVISSIPKESETKNRLLHCTFEDGDVVDFKMGNAINQESEKYAIGNHIHLIDGVYTIKKIDEDFYAVQNIHGKIKERIIEQNKDNHIVIRVEKFYPNNGLETLLNQKLSLKDKIGNRYDNIVVNGNIIGKFAGAYHENVNIKRKANEIFYEDYICERAQTYEVKYNNKIELQTFLLLKPIC